MGRIQGLLAAADRNSLVASNAGGVLVGWFEREGGGSPNKLLKLLLRGRAEVVFCVR